MTYNNISINTKEIGYLTILSVIIVLLLIFIETTTALEISPKELHFTHAEECRYLTVTEVNETKIAVLYGLNYLGKGNSADWFNVDPTLIEKSGDVVVCLKKYFGDDEYKAFLKVENEEEVVLYIHKNNTIELFLWVIGIILVIYFLKKI